MARPVLLLKNPSTPLDPYDEEFRRHGYHPVFIPLLHHSHWDRNGTIGYLTSNEFLTTPTFIITSKRGVEMFDDCLLDVDEATRRQIFGKTAYTVGPATADELSRIGFTNVRGGEHAGNGRKLAEIIYQELGPGNHRMVFFTGEIRKDILPKALLNYGFDLSERVIYKTEDRDDIEDQFTQAWTQHRDQNPWIVFFLPQGTESIVATLTAPRLSGETPAAGQVPVALIGPTTEEYLKDNHITPTVVAAKPTAKLLVDAILSIAQ